MTAIRLTTTPKIRLDEQEMVALTVDEFSRVLAATAHLPMCGDITRRRLIFGVTTLPLNGLTSMIRGWMSRLQRRRDGAVKAPSLSPALWLGCRATSKASSEDRSHLAESGYRETNRQRDTHTSEARSRGEGALSSASTTSV
jgi:hypothetical protein